MRYSVLVLFSFFLFVGTGECADRWDGVDIGLAGGFLVGQVLNYGQTNEVLNNDDWYEVNGLMPARNGGQLLGWKVGSSVIILGIAHYLPSEWRKVLLGGACVIVWGFVGHDYGAGVGFRW